MIFISRSAWKFLLGVLLALTLFSGQQHSSGALGVAEAKKPRKASDWAKVNFNGVEQQYKLEMTPSSS